MKTALVTGSSRGIGREIAKKLALNGYRTVINYNNNEKKAASLLAEIKKLGGTAIAVKADVSVKAEVGAMFRAAEESFGGIDLVVNNAAIASQKLFSDVTEEDWDRIFAVNVKGAYNCIQTALPHMIHEKSGGIINISSMWGITGASCEVHYSATKAALIGLTKALAKELEPSGIRVNCIAPGVIDTEMNGNLTAETIAELKNETPLERIGTPADVAELALFLASEKASFITGQVLSVNGGFLI